MPLLKLRQNGPILCANCAVLLSAVTMQRHCLLLEYCAGYKMKNVLQLIRVSTESQAASDRASIPAQRAVNERTAKAHGLTIVRSIEIADVSGAAVLLAPEIRELINLIADPQIHGVVAREFSRLMRPENFSDYALLQAF